MSREDLERAVDDCYGYGSGPEADQGAGRILAHDAALRQRLAQAIDQAGWATSHLGKVWAALTGGDDGETLAPETVLEAARTTVQRLAQAEQERDGARRTNAKLNRRCQSAESGLAEHIEKAERAGGSFGRTLANAAAVLYRNSLAAAEAQVRELREALEEIETSPSEMIEMFRREGFVFERDLSGELDDAGRWEKLAFTLYCKIVALASSATEALGERTGGEDEGLQPMGGQPRRDARR
jgi:hypothetical protein